MIARAGTIVGRVAWLLVLGTLVGCSQDGGSAPAQQSASAPPSMTYTASAPARPVAPEMAAPETVAPETVAPETVAPETVAPETTAPAGAPRAPETSHSSEGAKGGGSVPRMHREPAQDDMPSGGESFTTRSATAGSSGLKHAMPPKAKSYSIQPRSGIRATGADESSGGSVSNAPPPMIAAPSLPLPPPSPAPSFIKAPKLTSAPEETFMPADAPAASAPAAVENVAPISEPAEGQRSFAVVHHDDEPLAENALVEVYYATDRFGIDRAQPMLIDFVRQFRPAGTVCLAGLIMLGLRWLHGKPWSASVRLATWSALGVTIGMGTLGSFRLADDARREGRVYGAERGEIELGKCVVSIPRYHKTGEVEAPSITRLELREDPDQHVILLSSHQLTETDFYKQLDEQVQQTATRELFVFVHGFNVTFSDATRRAAQMAHDLPYTGTPVVFSWPSLGRGDPVAYTTDENSADWAVHHFEAFLQQLMQHHAPQRINLIAHSMGNRVMTEALDNLANRQRIPGKLREIVLAAPDVDAGKFRDVIGPALAPLAGRVTLYASANDEALRLSKKAHGYARAGDTGPSLVVVPGIDTIDVSQVDTTLLGHAYYGSNVSVLEDLFHLLTSQLPAEQRAWLVPNERDGMKYWILQHKQLEESKQARQGEGNLR